MQTENPARELQWKALEEALAVRFGKTPNLEAILFLIGIQELGKLQEKFSKEQKQDLMHVAVCRLFSKSGYYRLAHRDEEGWPHYEQQKPLPALDAIHQEDFLKDHVLLYFQEVGLLAV